ncbi:MAG: hypothetical protein JW889_05720 [Verrucomicrobia bacterium]|nr:hypothetical protein [Verrucomicrobiota bacterium]
MKRNGIALATLLTAVLLALASAQAALPSLSIVAGGVDIAQYMPKDSTFLVTINVGKLAETGLFETVQQMGGEDAFAELEALGIDPAKDIEQFMIGIVVDRENPDNDPSVFMALSGTFPSADKFVEAYKAEQEEDPETREVDGKTVYTMDDVDFCFLDGVILAVPLESDASDIEKMLGGAAQSVASNAELTALMAKVNKKATMWAVASLPEELRAMMAEDAEDAPFDVSTLQTLTGAFDYAQKVVLDVALGFTEEDGAQSLVDFWTAQVKPMAEMMGEQMPAVADLIGACEMKASGKMATLSLNMDKADFDSAIESMVQMIAAPMMGGGMMEDDTMEDDTMEDEDAEW